MKTSTAPGEHYDVVVIGAGMSGLAAAIRLAMFERRVLLVERHNAPGGLNSFYSIAGRKYDVGLHAVTNFVPRGTAGAPLTRLLRQLRIPYDALDLSPQRGSRVSFPFGELHFTNDIARLVESVGDTFPGSVDRFRALVELVRGYDDTALSADGGSARQFLQQHLGNEQLVEMLLLPLLYYGSAREDDMDVAQCVTMFKALYLEGFARPYAGVRSIIRLLINRYRELGGERRMKCGVKRLHRDGPGGRVCTVELDDGSSITAGRVLSSIGQVETLGLCDIPRQQTPEATAGRLSFVETITIFDGQPADYGWDDTILFFNTAERCVYARPDELVDLRSGVICMPNNYDYGDRRLEEGVLRVTALASYPQWAALGDADYAAAKTAIYHRLQSQVGRILRSECDPPIDADKILATDMFTPRTIKHFTGHQEGAVYGAPVKWRDGRTPVDNLFLCGTDQGFLGIVGALLSGISITNLHLM